MQGAKHLGLSGLFVILLMILLLMPNRICASEPTDSVSYQSFLSAADSAKAQGDYIRALKNLNAARISAHESGHQEAELDILIDAAILRLTISQFDLALDLLFSAEQLSISLNDSLAQAEVYNTIGANYHMQDEFEKAADYYETSSEFYLALGKKAAIARAYNNIGVLWKDRKDPLKALDFHRRSLSLWEELNETSWIRVTKGHIGAAHKSLGNLDSATYYFMDIIQDIEADQEYQTMATIYSELGAISLEKKKFRAARDWCLKGFQLATKVNIADVLLNNCECLYKAYENLNQNAEALQYYKLFASYQDSIFDESKAKEITRIEMAHQFERQQIEDSLRRQQAQLIMDLKHQEELAEERSDRNLALSAGLIIFLLAGGLFSRLQYVRKTQRVIKKERDRSDELLLNILPAEIADELKQNGKAKAKRFEEASILFTDFIQFTATAAQMSASAVVEEINNCFTAFDQICDKHGIEKIKTIGDAYMAAGGIPVPNPDSTLSLVRAALEMQEFVQKRAQERGEQNLPAFKMRAGIHLGPIVAGVVGVKKFQYDIWGDTVNTASRMESCSAEGMVNVSQVVYEELKNEPGLSFDYRGRINAKGKGEIDMYFVSAIGT